MSRGDGFTHYGTSRPGVPDAKAELDDEMNGERSREHKENHHEATPLIWPGLGTAGLRSGWRLLICPRKARASQCHLAA
ncbi:hypothetical protein SETIT_9G174700v2 [Setaria italica]|uniref:Uncharacterized protein n=1 Tax=Setaria italica TaxID=4555 RepID=A0A368SHM5_SETIT|nr:hypothetical protein SETIT_9G174700v2 [Setaria italica]